MRFSRQRGGAGTLFTGMVVGAILWLSPAVELAAQTGPQAPLLPSNHALIITVSEYQRSPLPGVLTDRKLANELARRFGVPPQNIVELSEQQVTREGLKQALASMNQLTMPGDKLYVYFSGHGARFFSKATGQCTESIVMQDMHVVTNAEFANMLKPLSAKTDKTIVMLDSCHSGGVAHAAGTRALTPLKQRPKYSAEASSPECSLAVNLGSFSQARGVDLNTTDNNLVILAAARNNEVAWDTSKGGALTYNFEQCLGGGATDSDHSGSLSMQELTECIQARLDKTQEDSARQHATLVGNSALVPAFGDAPLSGAAPIAVDTLATLNDIYNQRDDRWDVQATVAQPTLKIGANLALSVRSQRDGFVYLFYQGTQPGSFYLLFPNQLDSNNRVAANQEMQLPRPDWNVTALGPRGTDHLMVMVTETARDFSTLALPAEYVSQAGPFEKIQSTAAAAQHISRIATLSAAAGKDACQHAGAARDLGVAKLCSNTFGASLVSVEEID
ncbi:MAG TPA: caspase family protein [Steroidobacteraceae bacterium]|nr:caspase family protein [Steroidobacteraceae bacterium]